MGRDPQRAVPILIPARRVLTFKPSQVLKNALNGGETNGAGPSGSPPPA